MHRANYLTSWVVFYVAANGSLFYWNWGENYAGSSGLPTKRSPTPQPHSDVKVFLPYFLCRVVML